MKRISAVLNGLLVLLLLPVTVSGLVLSPLRPVMQAGYDVGSTFVSGADSNNDNFAVFSTNGLIFALDARPDEVDVPGTIAGAEDNKDLIYEFGKVDLPLYPEDYYWGKFENGSAGARELNRIPVLRPGDRIRAIGNGYLTLSPSSGYVRPTNGYYYGSGLCWSTSALGQMMDKANVEFREKYGMDLFVFSGGDRAPHPHWYRSYQHSNRGYGYTVIKISSGGGQDYSFTVNPAIASLPDMDDFKVEIVMTSTTEYPGAYNGQSIGSYVRSNKDVRLVQYTDPKEIVNEYKEDYSDHFRSLRGPQEQ